jgi:hypothetical protein
MKNGMIVSCCLVITTSLVITCSCKDAMTIAGNPPHRTGALVGLSLLTDQNAKPGLAGITESIDEVTAKGINLFGMAPEWPELESSPNTFSFQDPVINPLTLTDPGKKKFKSYILVLKMIDSNRKTLPADLMEAAFDDPRVMSRFSHLIDTLSKLPSIARVSHILIGNEADGYLTSHPGELHAFAVFFQAAVMQLHIALPSVKVGTIITCNAAVHQPGLFNSLAAYADFIGYTYYPTSDTNPNWQMKAPDVVKTDMAILASLAGNKPFAFTEIGYPSSGDNHSSPVQQEQFVDNMFNALRPYKDQGRLAFVFYHGLYDYPPAVCTPYAQSQGIATEHLCSFMNSLGLKDYATGQPKPAWNTFVSQLQHW